MTIFTGTAIPLFQMLTQKSALKLEILGMKHSQGSVYAHIKRKYNLKGSKKRVLEQFEQLIEEYKQNQFNPNDVKK